MRGWTFDIRSRSFVLLCALFAALTVLVYRGATDWADLPATAFFASGPGGPALDALMQYVTETGHVFAMMVFAIAVLLVPRTRRVGITLMILIVLATLLTGYIKCGVDRDRPDLEYGGVPFPVDVGGDTFALFCEGGFDASYPSGHAARTAAFAVVLGYALSWRFPRGSYLLLLYPALVSLSRVYVLEHYAADVVGGAVVGVLLAGVLARRTGLHRVFDPTFRDRRQARR